MGNNREAMIKKYGGLKEYRAAMAERGRRGGKAEVPKGFAMNPELAKQAGAKGTESKRKKRNV